MSTRASNARHVRQRKLNTKQPLRIIRENEIEEVLDEETQRQIHQVETGVEKGEEVAVISAHNAAALGAKAQQSYIPTPDAIRAKDVNYDSLYPKVFRQPATYIRFSSTVEDSVGCSYCMDEDDAKFLAQLNDGKDVNGQLVKEKLAQCSEDTFEEAMSFFEETSQRLQPFANVDNAPILSLEEMEQAREEPLSANAQKFLKLLYQYWVSRKDSRPLMPVIKVRLLDTTSDADDADPYVCFRRREVRQTRKTRGRDAQIVEKLKKLRLELEQARNLVHLVRQREELNKSTLEMNRKLFDERRKLREVKVSKGIKGEAGEDELLLVNQKPAPKPKARQEPGSQQRPATIRLRSVSERPAPDDNLTLLSDTFAEAEIYVNRAIESRKEQHRKWNQNWQDRTWNPITPPPEPAEEPPKWAPLLAPETGYPTPPPSHKSGSPVDGDGDVEMQDQKLPSHADAEVEGSSHMHLVQGFSTGSLQSYFGKNFSFADRTKQIDVPQCRIRYGRGGRRYLEARRTAPRAVVRGGVVSDSDSDEELEDFTPVPDHKIFEYRVMMNRTSNNMMRPDGSGDRKLWPSGDQSAGVSSTSANAGAPNPQVQQHAA